MPGNREIDARYVRRCDDTCKVVCIRYGTDRRGKILLQNFEDASCVKLSTSVLVLRRYVQYRSFGSANSMGFITKYFLKATVVMGRGAYFKSAWNRASRCYENRVPG